MTNIILAIILGGATIVALLISLRSKGEDN